MLRIGLLIVVILGCLISLQRLEKPRVPMNRSPIISKFESSATVVYTCGPATETYCSDRTRGAVTLTVDATDPNNDPLSYSYSTTGGDIFGEDKVVAWRLADQPFGKYSATVKVRDAKGAESSSSIQVSVGSCAVCIMPGPPCAILMVSPSSESIYRGEFLSFHLVIQDFYFSTRPDYVWTVTNGKITKGQHTPGIVVLATGGPPDKLVATVEVEGLDPACMKSADASVIIKQ